ncbi:hypothetical protein [Deinococcus rubellus]|uniref:Uncharacterized protein n=1 Tax=Deinococcus rubellus TaxID=1889240 RepID=A0ABY5YFB0_9DEIO|nr:hypothetical protein [Deinococcus rubellus]UWX62856.1 hypothetical protein N0D28_08740 [Deinococcus rubellus]
MSGSPAPRPRPNPKSSRPSTPPSGQSTTRAVLLMILLTAAVPVAARWVQGDFERWLTNGLTLLASGWLLWNVDRGSVLAWRVTVSLSIGLGVLAMLVGLVAGQGAWGGWIVTLVGLLFVGCGLLLVGVPDVREYLDGRWATWRRGKLGGGSGRP